MVFPEANAVAIADTGVDYSDRNVGESVIIGSLSGLYSCTVCDDDGVRATTLLARGKFAQVEEILVKEGWRPMARHQARVLVDLFRNAGL